MLIFWEIPSGNVVFSASWFDSGYMLFPVYGGFFTRILRSILILLSCSVFAAKSPGKLDFLVPRSCRQRGIGMLGLVLLVSSHFAQCFLLLLPYAAHCLDFSGTCMRQSTEW